MCFMKKTVIILSGIFFLLCIILWAFMSANNMAVGLFYKPLNIAFDLPNGDVLTIQEADSWEMSVSYYYTVKRKSLIIVPKTAFFYRDPDDNQLEFE